ncbi:MAG: ABC transporter [Gracilibacter sp. BRH_c7a]|nr:MAG: ABC transporter [Gracilibacter sp. BRH_c7a]
MLKLIKYLKPFAVTIIAIVILLCVQALSDLALPDYMSKIVDVGIQQGGIETAVPKAIRQSELDKIKIYMSRTEQTKVSESYILLDKSNLSKNDYDNYLTEYPKLAEEPIYILNVNTIENIEDLNIMMGKAILLSESTMEKSGLKNADNMIAQMPDSMITQAVVAYISKEYEIIGLNTNTIQRNYILYTGGVMLLIALLSMTATVIVAYLGARVAAALSQSLRKNVFRKVAGFSNSEFDKFSTASLITRSTNDVQQIQMLMVMLLRIVFYAPILGIGAIIKVLNSESSMGWIIAVAVFAILTLVIVLFSVAIPKFKIVQKLVDRLNLVTREILTGTMVIRAFNTQKHEEKKFEVANMNLTKTNLFINRIMAIMMPTMMLIMNGITLLIVWVGSHQIDQGVMQVGNMMAFIQYAMQIIMAFLMISMVSIMLPRATVSAERIGEILDANISVKDAPELEHLSTSYKGYIEFEHVYFRYPGAEEDVLTDLNFIAKPGQTTAFIGSTGSGKTTLINLIPRFYDVTGGKILINGTDIRKVSQHELRDKIGYVPQKAVLFSGTIESNLKYGVDETTEDEMIRAAKIAQAMNFINQKQEGFATNISQGGTNISGGQKQRLSIARALTKKPQIYLFDDSFSALDFKTDAALRLALKEETGGSTILIVAQRISTIMNSDQIIVLDEGKIVGIGTHRELMKNCEVYQQIALSQLSEEELA